MSKDKYPCMIFKSNNGYCVNCPSHIYRNTKIGEYHWDILQFQLGHIESRDSFKPVACERKYFMDYNL